MDVNYTADVGNRGWIEENHLSINTNSEMYFNIFASNHSKVDSSIKCLI